MELANCKECGVPPPVELFYGNTYIRCNVCKKMSKDHAVMTDAFEEWNEMNE